MLLASRISSAVSSSRPTFRGNFNKIEFVGLGVVFLTVLVVLPLASMLQYASNNGVSVFWDNISSPEAVFSLKFTLVLASATTLINAVMGTIVAFTLVRHDFLMKGVLDSLVDLPIAIPATVTGVTLLLLYGPLGMLTRLFGGAGISILLSFPVILIAHVFMTLPFVVRAVGPVLEGTDRSQEAAARTLGASEVQTFLTVILPSIKGGLISGSIVTFVRSLGEFGATIMVSGNLALRTQTTPMFIFSEFNRGEIEAATSMSIVLVLISVTMFLSLKLSVKTAAKGGPTNANRDVP